MSDDTASIEREIAVTRARLQTSVEALTYRANVPARAREAVNEKIDTVKETLARAIGRGRTIAEAGAEDALLQVKTIAARAAQTTSSIRETLGEPLGHAGDVIHDLPSSKGPADLMQTFLDRNPIGFALTAVATGLLIGFVLPISDVERDSVGPIGEQLIDDATSAASDVIEHGKAVVATITGTA